MSAASVIALACGWRSRRLRREAADDRPASEGRHAGAGRRASSRCVRAGWKAGDKASWERADGTRAQTRTSTRAPPSQLQRGAGAARGVTLQGSMRGCIAGCSAAAAGSSRACGAGTGIASCRGAGAAPAASRPPRSRRAARLRAPALPKPDDTNAQRAKSQPGNNAPFWRGVHESGRRRRLHHPARRREGRADPAFDAVPRFARSPLPARPGARCATTG